MKQTLKLWMLAAILTICGATTVLTSCADADEGESKADYELRNTINGPAWRVHSVMKNDGTWSTGEDPAEFWFEVKFSASNHNFKSVRFYYKNGEADETTREEYSSSDNTAYTIKNASIIEATVDGKPYFRITLKEKVTSTMHCDLYFYNNNKTYEVKMWRCAGGLLSRRHGLERHYISGQGRPGIEDDGLSARRVVAGHRLYRAHRHLGECTETAYGRHSHHPRGGAPQPLRPQSGLAHRTAAAPARCQASPILWPPSPVPCSACGTTSAVPSSIALIDPHAGHAGVGLGSRNKLHAIRLNAL